MLVFPENTVNRFGKTAEWWSSDSHMTINIHYCKTLHVVPHIHLAVALLHQTIAYWVLLG